METALRRIADTLAAALDASAAWFATDAWRPENWPAATWGLAVAFVVLLALLVWRRRAPRGLEVRPPQLLVTHGEVTPELAGSAPPARRRMEPVVHADVGGFSMTVSNLSRYPVQLLEVAVRDDRRGPPRVATVDAVVPALGSVAVSGRLPLALRGDGWLDLYCYAAAPRVKLHRHRVELVWEPWSARFKAVAVEQTTAPARRLASDEPRARFADASVEPAGPVPAPSPAVAETSEAAAPFAEPAPAAAPAGVSPDAPERMPVAPPVARPARPVAASAPRAVAPTATPTAEPAASPTSGRDAARSPAEAGVPRIATPPVGVAVTGRGGAADRTPDGVPIGRPALRSTGSARVPGPTAGDTAGARGVAAPAPLATPTGAPPRPRALRVEPTPSAAPADPVREAAASDEPVRADAVAVDAERASPSGSPAADAERGRAPDAPAPRRRPKLEFPDDF